VLEALLWAFHNAKSGLCFPSYETIAEAAHCARSTVAEAIKALEDAGIMTWVQRVSPAPGTPGRSASLKTMSDLPLTMRASSARRSSSVSCRISLPSSWMRSNTT
jgi:Helix-turn-helix domain